MHCWSPAIFGVIEFNTSLAAITIHGKDALTVLILAGN